MKMVGVNGMIASGGHSAAPHPMTLLFAHIICEEKGVCALAHWKKLQGLVSIQVFGGHEGWTFLFGGEIPILLKYGGENYHQCFFSGL